MVKLKLVIIKLLLGKLVKVVLKKLLNLVGVKLLVEKIIKPKHAENLEVVE